MENKISEQQFLKAYDSYMEAIFRFCFYKTNDRELAMDLMQQSFLKTWSYLKDGYDIDNIKAFVYKIAGNLVIDWYRKKKEQSLDNLREQGFDLTDISMDIERYVEARWSLETSNKLSLEDHQLIVFCYVEGMSPSEIASVTGKKVNTVSVAIHRAIERLKKILHEQKN